MSVEAGSAQASATGSTGVEDRTSATDGADLESSADGVNLRSAADGAGQAGTRARADAGRAGTGAKRRGRPPKAAAGDTKGELLRAALALFAAHGYEGTSVRAIARAVGLSESVLYAHFDSKRAIFEAVLSQFGPGSALTALDGLIPEAAGDPPGFLKTLVSRVMDEWSAPPARQLISLMAQDGLIHDPALMTGIVIAIGKLAGQFDRWIEAGLIAAGLGSGQELAYALIAPVALARVLWLHNGAKPDQIEAARERAARHAELFVNAVFRP